MWVHPGQKMTQIWRCECTQGKKMTQIQKCECTQGKKMTQSKSPIKNSKLFYMYVALLL